MEVYVLMFDGKPYLSGHKLHLFTKEGSAHGKANTDPSLPRFCDVKKYKLIESKD